jgi:hypothetical protein
MQDQEMGLLRQLKGLSAELHAAPNTMREKLQ